MDCSQSPPLIALTSPLLPRIVCLSLHLMLLISL